MSARQHIAGWPRVEFGREAAQGYMVWANVVVAQVCPGDDRRKDWVPGILSEGDGRPPQKATETKCDQDSEATHQANPIANRFK
eukprot:2263964-Amphidinium_carterae.1